MRQNLKDGDYEVYIDLNYLMDHFLMRNLIKVKPLKKYLFLHMFITHLWQIMNYLDRALQHFGKKTSKA